MLNPTTTIDTGNAPRVEDTSSALQPLIIVERSLGNAQVTLVGVEHEAAPHSYPWSAIRKVIERQEAPGALVLEYFPPELEHTIYRHKLLGRYARRYAAHAGINHFFGSVADIAADTHHPVIILDPANTVAFQLLYLHFPLAALALGAGWWWYDTRKALHKRSRWGKRALAGMLFSAGLGGVAWGVQDTRYRHLLQPLYREYALHMRDMRWVTIAQGLAQYCEQQRRHVVVVYPPTHMLDGIVHYLDHPEQRKKKYRFYAAVLPGITKAIRTYRWERDHWRLVQHAPITPNDTHVNVAERA
jgi:hypothetical protein